MVIIPMSLQPKPRVATISQMRSLKAQTIQPQQIQQPQITQEEYYRQQGVEQLQKIKVEQDRIQAKLNSAIEKDRRKSTDSTYKKVDFLEEQLYMLKDLENKAATGKYDYNALTNYAYDYAYYKANSRTPAPTKIEQKRGESDDEFEQRLIQQMRDKGQAYLDKQTQSINTTPPQTTAYSAPSLNKKDPLSFLGNRTSFTFLPSSTKNIVVNKTGITRINDRVTKDNLLIENPASLFGGTISYRPTTIEEMEILTKEKANITPRGALNLYKEKIVEPLAYEGTVAGIKVVPKPLAGTYTNENALNVLKLYQQEVVTPVSESGLFKLYEEKIVVPLSEKIVVPTTSAINKGIKYYKEKVVEPLAYEGVIPGVTQLTGFKLSKGIADTRNPITEIAKAKQYMDRLSNERGPDTLVQLYIGGKMKNVRVGNYANMGLLEFMQKVYGQQINAAWTQYAKDYSRTVYGKEVSEKTASFVGKTAEVTAEFTPYAIPGFFTAGVGAKVGEASFTKGAFGGPKSGIGFVKERPLEVALASALVYASVVGKTAKWASNTDKAKYEKYLTDKRVGRYDISRTTEDKSKIFDAYRPKVEKTAIGPTGFEKASIEATKKGTININIQEPKDIMFGKVKEMAQLKNNWGGIQGKKLDGKILIDFSNPNKIVRVVKYDDGVVKTIITQGEKITTKLFTKDGKILFTETKTVPGFVDELIKYKTVKTEAKIDLDSLDRYVIKVVKQRGTTRQAVELTDIGTGKKTLIDIEDKLAKDILQKQGRNLLTGKLKVDYSAEEVYSRTANKLLGRQTTTEKGLGDFIVSADKRSHVVFQSGAKKAKLEMATQQKIAYGIDTQSDVAFNIAGRGKAIKIDVKSAPFQRAIEQKFTERIIGYEITPTFKFTGKTKVPTAVSSEIKPIVNFGGKAIGPVRNFGDNAIGPVKQFGKKTSQALKKLGASKSTSAEVKAALDYQAVNYVAPVSTYIPAEASFMGRLSLTAPISIIGPGVTYGSKLSIAGVGASLITPRIKTKQDTTIKQRLNLFNLSQQNIPQQDIITDQNIMTDYKQDFEQQPKLEEKIQPVLQPILQPVLQPTLGPIFSPPTPPQRPPRGDEGKNIPPPIIVWMGPGEPESIKIPYQGQVLVKGKYRTVTDKPYTKSGARDVISRIIDNTTSATGRVVQMKKKIPQDKIAKGDGYFDKHFRKFRGFSIVQGRAIPKGNIIIEKRGSRIDTEGEKRGLSVARYLSERTRKKGRNFFRL